jgi:hypothetical protein
MAAKISERLILRLYEVRKFSFSRRGQKVL